MARESRSYDQESLQHVSMLSSSVVTTKERLQLCCKPTYKPRKVKSKGAILVLLWNFLIINVINDPLAHYDITGCVCLVAISLTLPVAGWLADTRIGRYKVIRCSIWIMWIATVLATVSSVVAQLIAGYSSVNSKVQLLLYAFMAIGFGGYEANITQFGMDQLHDASTIEITSFIIWYVWTVLGGGIALDVILTCLSMKYNAIRPLLLCANLTLALSSLVCYNHWLIKEPVKYNSFKMIYKVIKYVIRNNYARQRSAFTYCEDEPPSRIDFGKSKYGGPFTTEQVEDVKTFLRVLPVTIVGGALFGVSLSSNYLQNKLNNVFARFGAPETHVDNMEKCYSEITFTHTINHNIISILLIVLHEIIIYPVFHRCFPHIISLQKVLIGMLLQLSRVFILMAFEIVSRHKYHQMNSNSTIPCIFRASQGTLSNIFDHRWMAIPDFIASLSSMMCLIGAVEYFSAQVPYFMKGLAVGVTYSSLLLSGAILFVSSIPLSNQRLSNTWGASCGFWYALMLIVVEIGMCAILMVLMRWYKKRRRQDILPNEHIFAERYYSTILSDQ